MAGTGRELMGDLLILGHRGAAQLPENTVPSFAKALELGADGFALDVRQTADEKLVVVHGAVVGTLAVQASSYEQIRQLPDGFEIPLLKEVLKKFGRKAFLDIELKTPGFEQAAVDLIRQHCDPAKVLVSGFHPEALTKVYDLFPEIELGLHLQPHSGRRVAAQLSGRCREAAISLGIARIDRRSPRRRSSCETLDGQRRE